MSGTTISSLLTDPVTLGTALYPGPLTITASGGIIPTEGAAAALTVAYGVAFTTINNAGSLQGGPGNVDQIGGGYGLDFRGAASIINSGHILGGAGYVAQYVSGHGGSGIYAGIVGIEIQNSGIIEGGAGGNSIHASGFGGEGISGTATVANHGLIEGGAGGSTIYQGQTLGFSTASGNGGSGVYMQEFGRLDNYATITGGAGGNGRINGLNGNGGEAVEMNRFSTLVNAAGAVLTGGQGGDGGSQSSFAGTGGAGAILRGADLLNYGTIAGGRDGSSSGYGGRGGDGVFIAGYKGSNPGGTNYGTIIGGAGGEGAATGDGLGQGGRGFNGSALRFTNDGIILGGAGGTGAGGEGAIMEYGKLINNGIIAAGQSGVSGTAKGITGGDGVELVSATLVNSGQITAGNGFGALSGGGIGVFARSATRESIINLASGTITGGAGADGPGGAGVFVGYRSSLTNDGVITGGAGGSAAQGDKEGDGVWLDGAVFINAGTVNGGAIVTGQNGQAGRSDAVYISAPRFENQHSTLIIDPGAVFNGRVVAKGTGNELELSGTSSAPLTGLGTEFTGFTDIAFAPHAQWQISGEAGAFTGGVTISGFTSEDSIKLTNAAFANGDVTVIANNRIVIHSGTQFILMDVQGAVRGENDFAFADDTLTKSPPPAMRFLAPAAAPLAAGWSADFFAPFHPILLGHPAASSLQGGVQEVGHSPFIPPAAALPATDWPLAGYSLRLLGIGGTI